MTEKEWLQCTEVDRLMNFSKDKGSCRKYRLMVIACCRRIWHLLGKKEQAVVETAENFLERKATAKELNACSRSRLRGPAGIAVWYVCFPTNRIKSVSLNAVNTCQHAVALDLIDRQILDVPVIDNHMGKYAVEERKHQLVLFHDIFGNPFHPIKIEHAWQTPTIKALAQTIYTERQFADLPILADALEEAGCSNEDILGHCRNNQEHARGCWVLDILLGKK